MTSLFPAIFCLFSLLGSDPVTQEGPRVTRINPMAGELTWLLKDEFSRSHNQSRKTIVMMDATWCSACKQFIQLAKKPVLRTALKAVTIVAVDVDEWGGSALREAGFSVKKIPSFFRIRASGYPRGKPLTPAAWPSNKPERAAEAFRKFLEDDSSF